MHPQEPKVSGYTVIHSPGDSGPHVEYCIRRGRSAIWRRYSTFAEVNHALRTELLRPEGSFSIAVSIEDDWPMLPPMKFCGSMEPEFIEERRSQLHEWLIAVLKIPGVQEAVSFEKFMSPKEKTIDTIQESQASTALRKSITSLTDSFGSVW